MRPPAKQVQTAVEVALRLAEGADIRPSPPSRPSAVPEVPAEAAWLWDLPGLGIDER
jgi:hypothetical protein